jgi:hypothetical protein
MSSFRLPHAVFMVAGPLPAGRDMPFPSILVDCVAFLGMDFLFQFGSLREFNFGSSGYLIQNCSRGCRFTNSYLLPIIFYGCPISIEGEDLVHLICNGTLN